MYLCADLCINDTSTCGVKKVEFYGARVTRTWNVGAGTLTQILCKHMNSSLLSHLPSPLSSFSGATLVPIV